MSSAFVSRSLWISSKALFTSSIFAFWSKSKQTSQIFGLLFTSSVIWLILFTICSVDYFHSFSSTLAPLSICNWLLSQSISWTLAFSYIASVKASISNFSFKISSISEIEILFYTFESRSFINEISSSFKSWFQVIMSF